MLWLAFGLGGKFNRKVVEGRMNAVQYQRLLTQANIVENGVMIGGEKLISQQGNAPPHSVSSLLTFRLFLMLFMQARSTSTWFMDRGIQQMEWPALSPDLNQVENIWAILSHSVYAN